ncbi:MAG: NADH-quinone oxidoreductase subunit J [Thermoanaerobaculia bacterium]
MERIVFGAAAGLAILFAGVMVVHRNPLKSVLSLVVSFFALAVCFLLLAAPLIAAIQVIVYAGAILVLFLFVLMLLNLPEEVRQKSGRPIHQVLSGAAIVVFAVMLLALLRAHGARIPTAPSGVTTSGEETIEVTARLLFSEFLLPFEALSVLLLAALVGAFILTEKEKVKP